MEHNEHGEPWEVGKEPLSLWIKDNKGLFVAGREPYDIEALPMDEDKANRAVLCVNACAGMSDKDVEIWGDKSWLEKLIEPAKKNFAYWKEMAELAGDDVDALQSRLDEAVDMLSKTYAVLYNAERYNLAEEVRELLTKHKDNS